MIRRSIKAFSLIELIVVIAVMAAIAAVIIPSISGTREAAEEQSAISAAGTLNMAQVQYRLKYGTGGWPGAGKDKECYDAITEFMEYSESYDDFLKRYPKYDFHFKSLDGGKMVKVDLTKHGKTTPIPY